MNNLYPICIKLDRKKCVIIGGGNVAFQKAKSLLSFGADIRVISPNFCKELLQLSREGKIKIIKREYTEVDLMDAFLVIATTESEEINKKVFKEAHKIKALCNVVDNPDLSDFYVPSIAKFGDLIIAISTNGKSPALSKKIKSEITGLYGRYMDEVVSILGELREKLKIKIKNFAERKNTLNKIVKKFTFYGGPEHGERILENIKKEIQKWL